jgi:hypothetical protein
MKAHFITPVENIMTTPYPGSVKEWILRTPFIYYSEVLGREIYVGCPHKSFITDLGSIPRPLWAIYPPFGKYTLAVIIHDWLYWTQGVPRELADAVLKEAILVCGDSAFTANAFYCAVRIGGWKAWADNAKQDKTTGFVPNTLDTITVPKIVIPQAA